MAMRSLATRMWTPAAAALRRRPGTGVPPPARPRFLGTVCPQHGTAIEKCPYAELHEMTRNTIKDARRQVEALRRSNKFHSRLAKVLRWTLNLGVTTSVVVLFTARINEEYHMRFPSSHEIHVLSPNPED